MRLTKIAMMIGISLLLCGCSGRITRGVIEIINGEPVDVPKEYIETKGIIGGKFPGGYEAEGKPIIQFPPLSLKKEN